MICHEMPRGAICFPFFLTKWLCISAAVVLPEGRVRVQINGPWAGEAWASLISIQGDVLFKAVEIEEGASVVEDAPVV